MPLDLLMGISIAVNKISVCKNVSVLYTIKRREESLMAKF